MAPVDEGVILVGANVMVPHGLGPELDWQTDGVGEMESVRVMGRAVPLVRVALTVVATVEPATIDELLGLTDRV